MSNTASKAVGNDELAVLKEIALLGGVDGEVKTSCSKLGSKTGVSTQTASRRLQQLETAGLVVRDTVSDGQWVKVTNDGERTLRNEYNDYRQIFETISTVELTGRVTSGMGEGRHYITQDGYMKQFKSKLEYEPFPGTLNIELTDASSRRRATLDSLDAVHIDGWESENRTFGPALCYPVSITAGEKTVDTAHVVEPERTHHDETQIEVIAPIKLRNNLGVEDGDHVHITVTGK